MIATRIALLGWLAALMCTATTPAAEAQTSLNVLTWCDHEDKAFLGPFEQANGTKINFKDIDSTGAALAVIGQSKPGDWDLLVIDETDTPRLASLGLLEPLDATKFPFPDLFQTVADPALATRDGKLYAVPEKFGYNTVAFNRTKVTADKMADINAVWDPSLSNRIAIYDYYVPVIAYAAVALGLDPDHLTDVDLPALKTKLLALKANAALVGDVTTVQQALATGQVDVLVGGGEWVTAGLAKDNPDLAFVVPKQGGVRWQQGVAIFAASTKKDLAIKFAQYILSPTAQALLATSSCYWGMPANRQATLDDAQKKILDWSEQPGWIARTATYPAMTADFDKKLQTLWAEVLQAK